MQTEGPSELEQSIIPRHLCLSELRRRLGSVHPAEEKPGIDEELRVGNHRGIAYRADPSLVEYSLLNEADRVIRSVQKTFRASTRPGEKQIKEIYRPHAALLGEAVRESSWVKCPGVERVCDVVEDEAVRAATGHGLDMDAFSRYTSTVADTYTETIQKRLSD